MAVKHTWKETTDGYDFFAQDRRYRCINCDKEVVARRDKSPNLSCTDDNCDEEVVKKVHAL